MILSISKPTRLNEPLLGFGNKLILSELPLENKMIPVEHKSLSDEIQSEKILEIVLIYKKGIDVFGNAEKFNSWLETENLALGKNKPKSFLDSSFGINLLKDELTRIEYGILA